jgi:hypothetical protein
MDCAAILEMLNATVITTVKTAKRKEARNENV